MGRYRGDDPDLIDKIKELENRISRLERTPQASNASVNTGGITVRGGSVDVNRAAPAAVTVDSFGRTSVNGWDRTEFGGNYSVINGPTTDFSCDGSTGNISISAVNSLRKISLLFPYAQFFDLTVKNLVTVTPTGASIAPRIDFKYQDANNLLTLEMKIGTTSAVVLTLTQILSGVSTILATGTVANLTHSTSVPISYRISCIGQVVNIKAWRSDQEEPTDWTLSTTSLNANAADLNGIFNFGTTLLAGNTNTLPVVVKWDDLNVTEPNLVPYGTSEGNINAGSTYFYNGEAGMALTVTRSPSLKGAVPFDDGSTALRFVTVDGKNANPDFAFQSFNIFDKSGDTLISDSLNARRGFNDPKLGTTWYDPNTFKTTTSGSFVNVASAEWYIYHPYLRVRLLVQNDVGNVSELRLIETPDLTNTFSSFTTPSGAFQYVDLLVTRSRSTVLGVGGDINGNVITFSVDQRRVSGAGTVRCLVVSMVGIDLSWFNPY